MFDALAENIKKIKGEGLYITPDPLVLDWTNPKKAASLMLSTEKLRFDIPLPNDPVALRHLIVGLLAHFENEESKPSLIFGWNLKNFISYVMAKVEMPCIFHSNIFDLKVAESFCGFRDRDPPDSFQEAQSRILELRKTKSWELFLPLYRQIFLPLITDVIPKMETTPLAHAGHRYLVYPYYELEGTLNGRMTASGALKKSYLPHSLTPKEKESLHSTDYDEHFLCFDFRYMEVTVLQWLSNDGKLGSILESGQDLYEAVWEAVTGHEAGPEQRKRCKSAFLPIVYGAGPRAVAVRLEVSEGAAKALIHGIGREFPTAMNWVKTQNLEGEYYTDWFGRRIKFEEEYQVKNYSVSAPAALICLHKLVELSRNLEKSRLVFHLHDGYCILANKYDLGYVRELATKVLEAESDLYPGLKLKVSCQAGKTLATLKKIGV